MCIKTGTSKEQQLFIINIGMPSTPLDNLGFSFCMASTISSLPKVNENKKVVHSTLITPKQPLKGGEKHELKKVGKAIRYFGRQTMVPIIISKTNTFFISMQVPVSKALEFFRISSETLLNVM